MNPDYHAIFELRGREYHAAMARFPGARREEFERILALAAPAPGEVLVDMPSGGGYLHGFLATPDVRLIAVETAPVFHDQAARVPGLETRLGPLDRVDLPDGVADCVISLAGLHHVTDLAAAFAEMRRLLKPGGRLCVADGEAGSPVAEFLNGFVDAHNSMGHVGEFIDERFRNRLMESGFRIEQDFHAEYHWVFENSEEMAEYCHLLFGMDRATPEEVREGIGTSLGFEETGGGCRMNWGLRFVRCVRDGRGLPTVVGR